MAQETPVQAGQPAASRNPLLSIRGLTIRFGGLAAVDGVDFDVMPGQIYSIIGPNGAGKTTVFNVITGIYKPSAGQILFNGRSIAGLTPEQRLEPWHRPHLPEHSPLQQHVCAGKRAGWSAHQVPA